MMIGHNVFAIQFVCLVLFVNVSALLSYEPEVEDVVLVHESDELQPLFPKQTSNLNQVLRREASFLERELIQCIQQYLSAGFSVETTFDYCDNSNAWNVVGMMKKRQQKHIRPKVTFAYNNAADRHIALPEKDLRSEKRYRFGPYRKSHRYYPVYYSSVASSQQSADQVSKVLDEKIKRRHIMSITMATMLSFVVAFAALLFLWTSSTGRKMGRQFENKFTFNPNSILGKIFRSERGKHDCEQLLKKNSAACPKVKVNDRVVEFNEDEDCTFLKSDYSAIKLDTVNTVMSYLEKYKNQKLIDQEWDALLKYNSVAESIVLSGPRPKLNYNEIFDDDIKIAKYIASAWPHGCAQEFWNLIWERNCDVLVNLCFEDEFTEVYWPTEGKASTFGHLEIHFVSEHKYNENFVVRMFLVRDKLTKRNRTVCQYHFLMWSDGTTKSMLDIDSLLKFRRMINRSLHSKEEEDNGCCIALVHCNDGVGRTGSFILLDLVLNRILRSGAKEMNITATLQHLRIQRSGIVQTKEQFELAFIGVAKETELMLKFCQESNKNSHNILNV